MIAYSPELLASQRATWYSVWLMREVDRVLSAGTGEMSAGPASPVFQPVSRTGVIYVTTEAEARGFRTGDQDWCNLGQGMPESGPLEGAPDRVEQLHIEPRDQEYAPVAGLWELREAIAGLYNQLYRRGMPSKYSAENVAVSGGGRVALARVVASLGRINIGHFLPDYTAYAEILEVFRLVAPIPILLDSEQGTSSRAPTSSARSPAAACGGCCSPIPAIQPATSSAATIWTPGCGLLVSSTA